MNPVALSGIAWNHTRGWLPMVATGARFSESHPDVSIRWERRSLQEFADMPLCELCRRFDLLVIDHPWIGTAAEEGLLVPLDDYLPEAYLKEQAEGAVGASYRSYIWNGRPYALAVDAAAPVAAWRPDLLPGAAVPRTWGEVLDLAGRGRVLWAARPVGCMMAFYMMCVSLGSPLFADGNGVVDLAAGQEALERLRGLAARSPRVVFNFSPAAVYEAMTRESGWTYCPFAYGYSTYAREGHARRVLRFGEPVTLDGRPLVTVLGGAGLAVSSHCEAPEVALEYLGMVASPLVQRTLYFDAGGQPGHRSAWLDADVNARSGGFFQSTLPALDRAWLRPRRPGYPAFQEVADEHVHRYLRDGGEAVRVLDALEDLHYAHLLRMSR